MGGIRCERCGVVQASGVTIERVVVKVQVQGKPGRGAIWRVATCEECLPGYISELQTGQTRQTR